MLDAHNEVERGPYAVLWDACADMENFVERNLSGNFKGFASEVAACYERGQLTDASAVRAVTSPDIGAFTSSSATSVSIWATAASACSTCATATAFCSGLLP